MNECVHCGFCLQACPTYVVTGSEVHSPRGRIMAIKLGIPSEGLETCMFCRRCELACPSGVEYGKILEGARKANPLLRITHRFLEDPKRLYVALRVAQVERVKKFVPSPSKPLECSEERPDLILFPGCLTAVTLRGTVERALKFLRDRGFRVKIVNACCGLAHRGEGEVERAEEIIESLRSRFGDLKVISLSSNCTAHMKEKGLRVMDFGEFVVESGVKVPEVGGRVTVHDPCHANLLGITKYTREVLKRAKIEVREMEEPSFECGAGGSNFIFQPQISDTIMEEKRRKIRKSGVEVVVSTNPSCSLVIAALGFKVVHLVDLLAS